MIPQELIEKYFRNECNSDEKKLVLEYFQENPEEWNKYMTEEDWDNLKVSQDLDPGLSKRLFRTVSRNTFKKSGSKRNRWLAAATVSGLLLGLLWYYRPDKGSLISGNDMHAAAAPRMVEKMNATDLPLPIMLENGSTVVLSPNTSIRFYDPFVHDNKREVYLTGEALFKVAGNKARPFIVYSGDIATNVLGTEFTVRAFDESNVITVALHQGKVRVTAAPAINVKWKSDMVLLPGDKLTYDKRTMLATVQRHATAGPMVKAGVAGNKGTTVQRPDWYMFDASPLSDVFDQLSSYYQVDIYYYPSDISNKYFSGRMDKTDALDSILNDIALLNRLMIEKKNGVYTVRKKN